MKIENLYGKLTKYFDNGRNAIIGRLYGVVQLVITFAIYFSVTGETITLEQVALFSILGIIILLIIGFVYSKFGLLKAEFSARNMENPEFLKILDDLKKIKKKLNIM